MLTPNLQSERLLLRQLRLEDAPAIVRLLADDYEAVSTMSHMPWPCTEAAAQGWILLGFHSGARLFAILRRQDEAFLGAIGFGESLARPAVGYWIGRAYWNAGFATEALRCIVEYIKSLRAAAVRAETFPGNARSERVLQKCGFLAQGQARRDFPARGGVRTVNLWTLDLS